MTDHTYWSKQTTDKPLFPELLWSRPENRRQAGKLLIIGGNLYGFAAPAVAYRVSVEAGIGTSKVLLPEALHKTLGQHLETAEFAPSTPSGSFSQKALAEFLDHGVWADGVVLAGDLGRNSETAIVLENFIQKYSGPLTLTRDAADYTYNFPELVLQRPSTCLVLSLAQLQKLAKVAKTTRAVTFNMDLLQLVDFLHNFTAEFSVYVILQHLGTMFVSAGGQVSTTKLLEDKKIWRTETAAKAAVWWLQNPAKPFEAICTSVIS